MNMGFPAGLLALERLESGAVEWAGRLARDLAAWDLGDVVMADAPRIELKIEAFVEGGVKVSGLLSATLELECRRCLRSMPREIEVPLNLRFDPGIEREDETEGLYALDPQAAELDIAPVLREELLLVLPDFPLCTADCAGLCPRCGANRNDEGCECRPDTIDPRWDVLRREFPQDPETAEGPGGGSDEG